MDNNGVPFISYIETCDIDILLQKYEKKGWIIKFGENKKAQKIGKAQGMT